MHKTFKKKKCLPSHLSQFFIFFNWYDVGGCTSTRGLKLFPSVSHPQPDLGTTDFWVVIKWTVASTDPGFRCLTKCQSCIEAVVQTRFSTLAHCSQKLHLDLLTSKSLGKYLLISVFLTESSWHFQHFFRIFLCYFNIFK